MEDTLYKLDINFLFHLIVSPYGRLFNEQALFIDLQNIFTAFAVGLSGQKLRTRHHEKNLYAVYAGVRVRVRVSLRCSGFRGPKYYILQLIVEYTFLMFFQVFQGNTNDNGTKRVLVNPLVTAQYIRLHPTNCSGHCALRMEFYGCKSGII